MSNAITKTPATVISNPSTRLDPSTFWPTVMTPISNASGRNRAPVAIGVSGWVCRGVVAPNDALTGGSTLSG